MQKDKYRKRIDKQIESNKGKNLFPDEKALSLSFIDDTIKSISDFDYLSPDLEKVLIDYATEKALEEFARVNQYYAFNTEAKEALRKIYCELFYHIKTKDKPVDIISSTHYLNLKRWLKESNPFAERLYTSADNDIKPIACSEYGEKLQILILKIDEPKLMGPILDIGCGKEANLVKYLLRQGFDAYGIDRFSFTDRNLEQSDWLEYDYGIEKWGTIVSNLGFSNHFWHHHLREDGNYLEYGKKYMGILKSLKTGGSFHYAPELPFIEQYLDTNQFKVDRFQIEGVDYKTSIVSRLT